MKFCDFKALLEKKNVQPLLQQEKLLTWKYALLLNEQWISIRPQILDNLQGERSKSNQFLHTPYYKTKVISKHIFTYRDKEENF